MVVSSVLALPGLYVASVPNHSGRFAFNQGGSHTIKAASLIVFKVTLKYPGSQNIFFATIQNQVYYPRKKKNVRISK